MKTVIAGVLWVVLSGVVSASVGPQVDIPTRARGSATIVLATIVEVHSSFERSAYGDQLIVSHALLQVEETMKGAGESLVSVDIEGGSVGDLTLRVSDLPSVATGERGVFFLERSPSGTFLPHLRGLGILKVDAEGRVRGSSLTVGTVRSLVQGVR